MVHAFDKLSHSETGDVVMFVKEVACRKGDARVSMSKWSSQHV